VSGAFSAGIEVANALTFLVSLSCLWEMQDGVVQHHGMAHGIDYNLLDTLAAAPAAAESPAAAPANQELVFDEDF
jgi:hypothetical protein